MRWLLAICFCCVTLLALAQLQYTIGTQGRKRSSYDSIEEYGGGRSLNGLNGYSVVTNQFGTTWISPYVDRANAFGLQVFDTMESYATNVPVNGLVAMTWNTAYSDRQNAFPGYANDTVESYGGGVGLNGLNGGGSNGVSLVVWNGAYVAR